MTASAARDGSDWLTGGCHCGRIRYRVRGRPRRLLICNCSICTMKAYLHWIVPPDDFVLETAEAELATYRFNTGAARHHFCPTCGVAPFYIARSNPNEIDVNARCVTGLELDGIPLETFDGANWDAAYERYDKSP